MSFTSPHTLVTASYDGELVLWNTSSEQAFRHLNCKARKVARTNRRLRKLVRFFVIKSLSVVKRVFIMFFIYCVSLKGTKWKCTAKIT